MEKLLLFLLNINLKLNKEIPVPLLLQDKQEDELVPLQF
jgi:hypothetical protein